MTVSIIIPTYDRLELLKCVYKAILDSLSELPAEIIIVNDDKRVKASFINKSLGLISDQTIIVDNLKQGAASARNLGASLAKGELLIFIDDDILLNAKTLLNVIALHKRYDKILSTPLWEYSSEMTSLLVKNSFGRYRLQYDYTAIRGEAENEMSEYKNVFKVNSLASFCLSIKRHHYIDLKGMDETFPYAGCEDQDFAIKARTRDFKLLLDENNVVLHHELDRLNRKNWMQRQFNGVQGYVLLAKKYPERQTVPLWYENTEVQFGDNLPLKIKKVIKHFFRQDAVLFAFNGFVNLCEQLPFSDTFLNRLFSLQSGIYINKGFTKSYRENACNSHHGK